MVRNVPSTGFQASIFGCFGQELTDLVFTERRHLAPCRFTTSSVVVYGQKERKTWSFCFLATVAIEDLEMPDWASLFPLQSLCNRCSLFVPVAISEFSAAKQKPERARPLGTSLEKRCPLGLFPFPFSSPTFLFARSDFPSPHYLPLGLLGW